MKLKANAGECQGNKPTEGLGVSFVLESLVEGSGQWDGVGGGAFLELPSWLGIMAPLRDRLRDSGLNLTTGRAGRLEACRPLSLADPRGNMWQSESSMQRPPGSESLQ